MEQTYTNDLGGQARDFGQTLIYYVQEWGPRILAALVILLIGYILARAAKWAVAALVNKTSLAKRAHSHRNLPANHDRHPETIGAQLGNAAFWVVLLIALMLAAQPLGLDAATGPLGAMLNDFGRAIPHIIGAGLILFIGSIVASVAKKAVEAVLTAANTDRLFGRLGVSSPENPTVIPRVVGGIVFALIIIPVAIAALEQLNIRSISEPATAMLRLVLDAIPLVIAAGIILALAVAIGRFAGNLLTQFLQSTGFDRTVGQLGFGGATSTTTPGGTTVTSSSGFVPSKLAGQAVTVAITLFGLMEAFRQLNFTYGSRMMAEILALLGSVIFGAVIIAVGVVIARFVAQAVEASGGRTAAQIVRVAIIVLASAIGLRFMGLADDIINLAFGLIIGSIAVAAALAFGLGGRQAAARIVEKMATQAETSIGSASGTTTRPTTSGSTATTATPSMTSTTGTTSGSTTTSSDPTRAPFDPGSSQG